MVYILEGEQFNYYVDKYLDMTVQESVEEKDL